MRFTSETTTDGVSERLFELEVAGERVPGVLWAPAKAEGARPLLLLGHGGSQHKKMPRMVEQARYYVTACGFAVAALDAPNHGERPVSARFAAFATELRQRMTEGQSVSAALAREMAEQARIRVPEWRATLDALQALPFVGVGRVGYCGLSMGTAIGVPLAAAEPRICAAVLGLFGLFSEDAPLAAAAAKIAVPVEFVLQWDDQILPRPEGLALFAALGSREKTLHANAGGHVQVPAFEYDGWQRFLTRHLAPAG